jgi:hypothetical protein
MMTAAVLPVVLVLLLAWSGARRLVTFFVSSSDGLRPAKAFMQIPRFSVRHRIVKLVQEIAGDDGE